jgi:hypothetical protein
MGVAHPLKQISWLKEPCRGAISQFNRKVKILLLPGKGAFSGCISFPPELIRLFLANLP